MKKIILYLLLFGALAIPAFAGASIDTNLYYGVKNKLAVTELQSFFINQQIMKGPATGNFYILTQRAVKSYQAKKGLPITGYVGVLTRQEISNDMTEDLQGNPTQKVDNQQGLSALTPKIIDNILNQIAQKSSPQQPAAAGNNAPVKTMEPFEFEPQITNDGISLIVVIKEKFDRCNLVISDSQGRKVREQDYWMQDKDGNSRQVYDMSTKGRHVYSITCSKDGFSPVTKTGDFPDAPAAT